MAYIGVITECECNGGPACDCPECDHLDCAFQYSDNEQAHEWLHRKGHEVDLRLCQAMGCKYGDQGIER